MINGSKRAFRLCIIKTIDIDIWNKLAPDEEYPGELITKYFHYEIDAINAFESAKLGKFTNGKIPDWVTLDSGYTIGEEYTCTGWMDNFTNDWYEKTKNKDMNAKANNMFNR